MIKRKFFPGDKWLYYKIYGSDNVLEYILSCSVIKIIEEMDGKSIFKKFFFLRYVDHQGSHLRLRFLANSRESISIIIDNMRKHLDQYLQSRVIKSICMDVYVREIERYGEDIYHNVETLFYLNSVLIIKNLERKDPQLLYQFVDNIIATYFKSYLKKHQFFEDFLHSFIFLKKVNKNVFYNESRKYVSEKLKSLPNIIESKSYDPVEERQKVLLSKIQAKITEVRFINLLRDLVHLTINRFSNSCANENEIVIYYTLSKVYLKMHIVDRKDGNS